MDLLLWRHAEAFDARPGDQDAQRALTPEGERQAARMAEWLRAVLPATTRVIASPARRTQQTAQALGRPVETVPALASGATAQAVLQAAGWPNATRPVLVVGHQPTLGLVASTLMAGSAQHWWVQKAAVWWLRGEPDGYACLVAMHTPELP
jgi:phosphohistidine phosphatase